MKRITPEMERIASLIDHAWLKSTTREELAQAIFDEGVSGGNPHDLKDYVWEGLGEWAKLFLATSRNFKVSAINIHQIQEYLLPDVIDRTNEMIKEMKEKYED
jgi:hypothetical protein